MLPRVEVSLKKLEENAKRLQEICKEKNIEIVGITKVFGGAPEIASVLSDSGLKRLGDSRVENLKKYKNLPCEKWLIRMPAISEVSDVVTYADVSLNSEIRTLQELDKAAVQLNKTHGVIIMVDLGDLREGYISEEELADCINFVKQANGLKLIGLGTNLACFSCVQPDFEKLSYLKELSDKYDAGDIISGGNSSTIKLMLEDGIPDGVNTLRLGESLLFGRERATYTYLEGMHKDAFIMKAEVIEAKNKPSMPWGTIGKNSYGVTPVHVDKGIRKKVICAVGRQDLDAETMWPIDEGIEILSASSDHMMLDVTESQIEYQVGDVIEFRLGYFSTMRAFTNEHIEKIFI